MKKINDQGTFEEVDIGDTRMYLIFTRAGNYRGGKIYDTEKKFTLISGKVELRTFENGEDVINECSPGTIITIPAGVPNLFYFREDSEMIEWFDKKAKSEYFKRYKQIKDQTLESIGETIEK